MPVWCPKCNAMLAEGTEECPRCSKKLETEDAPLMTRSGYLAWTGTILAIALIPIIIVIVVSFICVKSGTMIAPPL